MATNRKVTTRYILADSQKVGKGINKARKGYSTYNPLSEEAYQELHYNKPVREGYSQPGDVYGPPRFFRYGEGGRSKKKNNSYGFMQKNEGEIADDQFKRHYKK